MPRLMGYGPSRAFLSSRANTATCRTVLRRRFADAPGNANKTPATTPGAVPGVAPSSKPSVSPPSQAAIPPPRPRKRRFGFFTRTAFYGSTLAIVFYSVATFFALRNDRWHDLFVESVPLGETIMDYFDEVELKAAAAYMKSEVERAASEPDSPPLASSRARVRSQIPDQRPTAEEDLSKRAAELKERAQRKLESLADATGKDVEELKRQAQAEIDRLATTQGSLTSKSREVIAGKASSPRLKFSDPETNKLVKEAEAALKGPSSSDAHLASKSEDALKVDKNAPSPPPPPHQTAPLPGNVYTSPLPLGFEPPPGYRLPSKDNAVSVMPKPTEASHARPFSPTEPPSGPTDPSRQPDAPPAAEPLPLVSSLITMEHKSSEPVIAQLASTIDALSAQLSSTSNPTAISSARGVIDTAKTDLEQLAQRMEHVKEEQRQELSKKLESTRDEWEGKLRGLEKEAQEKLDKQEDGWKHAFEGEKSKLITEYKEKLQAELDTQSELINQRLKEEVIAQGIELQRRWIREIKVRVEQERGARLAKLEDLSSSFKQLERLTLDNSAYLDENLRLHALNAACHALQNAIDAPVRKPFRTELRILRNMTAAKEDPVITAALDSLEASDLPDVGVEPYTDLATWFTTTVYPRVVSVALVPDENAGVLEHIASSILSHLRFKRRGLVEGNDVLSSLARAEHYVGEKDLENTARELNQLKGTAKILLGDWLAAARRRLEVEQALEVVNTQATLASLLVV
ncbi:hypothetical protein DACRYDRAFT_75887 [Dacryopinax primogenitus]|uniref:MICOS complex subunit MIC60 n=1 Tax=Dacryopinax primogenitus (strain DJM 731) TaxID=1858805 RepID=M5GG53_DACPD|nr:uncharacterized protein DACRYDRAFT_75887 [Dacryopinax primogenitus]EJU04888.1 hypothetical protein DACRYDRAFT_75887 [Dacryopinax primogenitus]